MPVYDIRRHNKRNIGVRRHEERREKLHDHDHEQGGVAVAQRTVGRYEPVEDTAGGGKNERGNGKADIGFLFAELFVNQRNDTDADNARQSAQKTGKPRCIGCGVHGHSQQAYLADESTVCLNTDNQRHGSGKAEDVDQKDYQNHFIRFNFGEHLFERNRRSGLTARDGFTVTKIDQKI